MAKAGRARTVPSSSTWPSEWTLSFEAQLDASLGQGLDQPVHQSLGAAGEAAEDRGAGVSCGPLRPQGGDQAFGLPGGGQQLGGEGGRAHGVDLTGVDPPEERGHDPVQRGSAHGPGHEIGHGEVILGDRAGGSAHGVPGLRQLGVVQQPGRGEVVEVQRDTEDVLGRHRAQVAPAPDVRPTFGRVDDLGLQPQLTGEVHGPWHPEQKGVGPFVHRVAGERRGVDLAAPTVGGLVDGDVDAFGGGQLPGGGQAGDATPDDVEPGAHAVDRKPGRRSVTSRPGSASAPSLPMAAIELKGGDRCPWWGYRRSPPCSPIPLLTPPSSRRPCRGTAPWPCGRGRSPSSAPTPSWPWSGPARPACSATSCPSAWSRCETPSTPWSTYPPVSRCVRRCGRGPRWLASRSS